MFSRLSNFQLFLAFLSILALRLIVGFHFFNEGVTKLNDKTGWTAEYFLKGAKGPLAKQFHELADDADGRKQPCIDKIKTDSGKEKYEIDPKLTLAIWKDFVDQATNYYGFGSPEKIEKWTNVLAESGDAQADSQIKALQNQPRAAQIALESHQIALEDWIGTNRIAILALSLIHI